MFEETGETKAEFIDLIGDNNISLERFAEIKNDVHKKLFIHYFTSTMLLKAFLIKDVETRYMYVKYITEEFPLIYQRLVKYIAGGRIPYSVLEGIYLVIGKKLVSDIMREIDFNAADTPYVINNLMKVQNNVKRYTFDFNLVKLYFTYNSLGFMKTRTKNRLITAIQNLEERIAREILTQNFDEFKEAILNQVADGEVGAEYIIEQINAQLNDVYHQLSLFDI